MIRALLLVLLVLAPAASAQQASATADATSSELETDAALARLAQVLADDQARAALLAALQEAQAPAAAASPSLAASLAAGAEELARDVAAEARLLAGGLAGLGSLGARLPAIGPAEREVVAGLLATILATVAASLAFEAAASALARRLRPPPGAGPGRRASRALVALLGHLAAVLLAWLTGAVLVALLFSEDGQPWPSQLLYLRAFLAFGLARVALRAAANPDAWREPALSPVDPGAQRVVHLALRPVVGLLAQGFLFVVPLVRHWAGFAATRPARTLVATVAALGALWAIRRMTRALHHAPAPRPPAAAPWPAADPPPGQIGPPPPPLAELAPPSQAPVAVADGLGALWRWLWPPLAVVYVAYAWMVAVTRPALLADFVLMGSALTVLAVLLLLGGLRLMRRAHHVRLPLPDGARLWAPTLGPRANRVLAAATAALGGLMVLASPLLVAWGWGWLDPASLWQRPWARAALGQALSALLVLLGAGALWAVVASLLDARLARSDASREPARVRTLLALFRNAFTIAVAVLAGMVALSQLGLDIAPLLAGAGVAGLAIGFGAQTLVKDIITGVFIQLEGAMDVGDVVTVAGISGGVERITIRSVRLRTLEGATNIIPFSSITTVTNLTRDYGYHVADLLVGYGQSVPAVRAAMQEAFERLQAEPEMAADIEGALDLQGVAEMRGDSILVRARIRTRPGRQWDVGRRYSEVLKEVLDARGITVPAPSRTILVPDSAAARPLPVAG